MKTFFLVMGLSLSLLIVKAQEKVTLELEFENIQEEGSLMVAVFDSQENWSEYHAVEAVLKEVKEKSSNVTFDLLQGRYGIVAFIDTNGNHFYDYGKEWYAFSSGYIPRENPTFERFAIGIDKNEKKIMKMVK